MKIFLIILFFNFNVLASSTRVIEADSLISSDHTKTWTFPSGGGALGTGTAVQETPSGTINGSNTNFTLSNTPISNAIVNLYLDGVILIQGTDYTISTTTITMTTAPALGQALQASYFK